MSQVRNKVTEVLNWLWLEEPGINSGGPNSWNEEEVARLEQSFRDHGYTPGGKCSLKQHQEAVGSRTKRQVMDFIGVYWDRCERDGKAPAIPRVDRTPAVLARALKHKKTVGEKLQQKEQAWEELVVDLVDSSPLIITSAGTEVLEVNHPTIGHGWLLMSAHPGCIPGHVHKRAFLTQAKDGNWGFVDLKSDSKGMISEGAESGKGTVTFTDWSAGKASPPLKWTTTFARLMAAVYPHVPNSTGEQWAGNDWQSCRVEIDHRYGIRMVTRPDTINVVFAATNFDKVNLKEIKPPYGIWYGGPW